MAATQGSYGGADSSFSPERGRHLIESKGGYKIWNCSRKAGSYAGDPGNSRSSDEKSRSFLPFSFALLLKDFGAMIVTAITSSCDINHRLCVMNSAV